MKRRSWWSLGALALGFGVFALRLRRRLDLDGRVAVIAGGSRGLGLVLARELAARRARIVLMARDVDELERARVDLAVCGANDVLIVPCDVTQPAQVDEAVATVLDACGRIDVLIDCAGDIEVGPLEAMRYSDFERAMATNFWGPLHLVRAVLPGMRARGGGRIVNISSVGGVVAVPHLLPYVASKFALTGLSLGLRSELAKHGIVVTTVCPGLMRTGSPGNALFKGDRGAEYSWFSVSDSLPLLSMSAERAARRIVRAIQRGKARVVLGMPAKMAAVAQALAPGVVAFAMETANRLLPASEDARAPSTGNESRAAAHVPRWLTTLGDRAAARNNE